MEPEEREATLTRFRLKEAGRNIRREYAELVYHYPQYTLDDLEDLPSGDLRVLLTYARLRDAEQTLQLAISLASVQTKAGFKKYTSHLEGVIKDLTKAL